MAKSLNADASYLLAWVRLIRSENVGPATFHDLVRHYGDIHEALYNLPHLAKKSSNGRPVRICSVADAEKEIEQHQRLGATLLTLADADYPAALAQVGDAPPVISVLGNVKGLQVPHMAIVGARNASLHGRNFARNLSFELGGAGWWVASGLAHGIDTAAHEGALNSGTTAVVACGVDQIYPSENIGLYNKIREQGCVVSEAPLGAKPQSSFFPRRNRIISGLSKGVIVVEAAMRSGSLITARFANEQGRDVFAVPGSPFDPRCRGTNHLIQQGAPLIQSCADVLSHYETLFRPQRLQEETPAYLTLQPPLDLDQDYETLKQKILDNLSFSPISLDELTRQCDTTPERVQGAVIELELSNSVFRPTGSQVMLAVGEK